MMSWPTLSRGQLSRDNLLYSRQNTLKVPTIQGELPLVLLPQVPPPAVVLTAPVFIGEGQVWLGLGEQALNSLIQDNLGEAAALGDLPPTLQTALLMVCLAPLLNQARELLQTGVELAALTPTPPDPLPAEYLVFQLGDGGGVLWYHPDQTDSLLALLQDLPPLASLDFSGIASVIALVIGSSRLPVSALRTLAVEDVLLLEEAPASTDHLWLWVGSRALAVASLEAAAITIITLLETPMSEDDDASDTPAATALKVDDLPVELSFEVGRLRLSFRELQDLQLGQSFPLERDPTRPVTVRANGQAIATGELVQIGETLGVRIVELAPPHG